MLEGERKNKSKDKPEEMSKSEPSSTRQKTVAIVSKPGRPELSEVLPVLEKWLAQHNTRWW